MSFPTPRRLVVMQVRYQLRIFARTPVAAFFTLVLPITMLVLFNALFADGTVDTPSGAWPIRQFYTGSLAAFAAVSATYTNLANTVPILRDEGVLKRWRGTPIPPWAYVAGMIGSAVMIALVGVGIMIGLGVVAYDLQVSADKLPAAAVTFVLGVAAFAALGMACAAMVPNARSAPAVANATLLPLAFVSNVFIPLEDPPRWLEVVGDFFPLKPFVVAFQDTFNPFVDAPAFDWGKLAWLALWGVAGTAVALRRFRWEPSVSDDGSTPSGRRRG
jgi:ABC-2 type transport system permease protein